MVDRIAGTRAGLRLCAALTHVRVSGLAGAPQRLTIDLDATLITSHSEKDQGAGTFRGGYGFAPMLAYAEETGEGLAGMLRPGNAGANNAEDQIRAAEQAVADPRGAH